MTKLACPSKTDDFWSQVLTHRWALMEPVHLGLAPCFYLVLEDCSPACVYTTKGYKRYVEEVEAGFYIEKLLSPYK